MQVVYGDDYVFMSTVHYCAKKTKEIELVFVIKNEVGNL